MSMHHNSRCEVNWCIGKHPTRLRRCRLRKLALLALPPLFTEPGPLCVEDGNRRAVMGCSIGHLPPLAAPHRFGEPVPPRGLSAAFTPSVGGCLGYDATTADRSVSHAGSGGLQIAW